MRFKTMRYKEVSALAAMAALCLVGALGYMAPQSAFAAHEAYLYLDGIPGESIIQGHQNEIELLGWGWGLSKPASAGSTGSAPATFRDMTIFKEIDKSSPLLFLRCASGQTIPSATLSVQRNYTGGPYDYITIELTNVVVSGFDSITSGTLNMATETVRLSYARIQFTYVPLDSGNHLLPAVTAGWDVVTQGPYPITAAKESELLK